MCRRVYGRPARRIPSGQVRAPRTQLDAVGGSASSSDLFFLGSVASFFADDVPLGEMYRRLVDDSAAGIVEVVRGIIADQPVLVHCTVGKDRTAMHPEAVHLEELATRSPAPVMRDLLARVSREFGSPSDYLRAQGMSDGELAELRRVLIQPL